MECGILVHWGHQTAGLDWLVLNNLEYSIFRGSWKIKWWKSPLGLAYEAYSLTTSSYLLLYDIGYIANSVSSSANCTKKKCLLAYPSKLMWWSQEAAYVKLFGKLASSGKKNRKYDFPSKIVTDNSFKCYLTRWQEYSRTKTFQVKRKTKFRHCYPNIFGVLPVTAQILFYGIQPPSFYWKV